jgi:diguanylate cyclase (GGDEF)-like protein
MVDFSVQRLLEVVRDFEGSGGASLGLVAWELRVDEGAIADRWLEAQSGSLLEPSGRDRLHGEDMWRLTRLGWDALGVAPTADRRRADAVARLGILDRIGDPALTALTRIGSHLMGGCGTAVNIFDERYQRRIAAVHAPLETHPARDTMCHYVVDGEAAIAVSDASCDARFAHISWVQGERPVRFYAAVPLRTSDEGAVVGTLCAFDFVARDVNPDVVDLFGDLAQQAIAHIEYMRLAIDLGHLATHDPLTGAVNRLLLPDRIRQALARQRRVGGDVLVITVDVDDFKSINDAHGHAAGDEVLCVLARRLADAVRTEDTVSRLGGDEFVLLTELSAGEAAGEIIDRLATVAEAPIAFGDTMLNVRVSLGAAIAGPDDDASSLLERSDRELYDSKRAEAR